MLRDQDQSHRYWLFRWSPRPILHKAHLEWALLSDVHLEGALLYGTHLEGANLFFTHLERADLEKAHLDWAQLQTAQGLTIEQLVAARPTQSTHLPAHLRADARVRARIASVEEEEPGASEPM
ncbi:pentapeptide repeat-containing protein [Streptomyces asiaticus]